MHWIEVTAGVFDRIMLYYKITITEQMPSVVLASDIYFNTIFITTVTSLRTIAHLYLSFKK